MPLAAVPILLQLIGLPDNPKREEALDLLCELVGNAFGGEGIALGASVRDSNGVMAIIGLMDAEDTLQQALYLIANLASDAVDSRSALTKRDLLQYGASGKLLKCLSSQEPDVVTYACAALQNCSTDQAWANKLVEGGAVMLFEALLVHPNELIQRYAAGAIKNLVGVIRQSKRSTSSPQAQRGTSMAREGSNPSLHVAESTMAKVNERARNAAIEKVTKWHSARRLQRAWRRGMQARRLFLEAKAKHEEERRVAQAAREEEERRAQEERRQEEARRRAEEAQRRAEAELAAAEEQRRQAEAKRIAEEAKRKADEERRRREEMERLAAIKAAEEAAARAAAEAARLAAEEAAARAAAEAEAARKAAEAAQSAAVVIQSARRGAVGRLIAATGRVAVANQRGSAAMALQSAARGLTARRTLEAMRVELARQLAEVARLEAESKAAEEARIVVEAAAAAATQAAAAVAMQAVRRGKLARKMAASYRLAALLVPRRTCPHIDVSWTVEEAEADVARAALADLSSTERPSSRGLVGTSLLRAAHAETAARHVAGKQAAEVAAAATTLQAVERGKLDRAKATKLRAQAQAEAQKMVEEKAAATLQAAERGKLERVRAAELKAHAETEVRKRSEEAAAKATAEAEAAKATAEAAAAKATAEAAAAAFAPAPSPAMPRRGLGLLRKSALGLMPASPAKRLSAAVSVALEAERATTEARAQRAGARAKAKADAAAEMSAAAEAMERAVAALMSHKLNKEIVPSLEGEELSKQLKRQLRSAKLRVAMARSQRDDAEALEVDEAAPEAVAVAPAPLEAVVAPGASVEARGETPAFGSMKPPADDAEPEEEKYQGEFEEEEQQAVEFTASPEAAEALLPAPAAAAPSVAAIAAPAPSEQAPAVSAREAPAASGSASPSPAADDLGPMPSLQGDASDQVSDKERLKENEAAEAAAEAEVAERRRVEEIEAVRRKVHAAEAARAAKKAAEEETARLRHAEEVALINRKLRGTVSPSVDDVEVAATDRTPPHGFVSHSEWAPASPFVSHPPSPQPGSRVPTAAAHDGRPLANSAALPASQASEMAAAAERDAARRRMPALYVAPRVRLHVHVAPPLKKKRGQPSEAELETSGGGAALALDIDLGREEALSSISTKTVTPDAVGIEGGAPETQRATEASESVQAAETDEAVKAVEVAETAEGKRKRLEAAEAAAAEAAEAAEAERLIQEAEARARAEAEAERARLEAEAERARLAEAAATGRASLQRSTNAISTVGAMSSLAASTKAREEGAAIRIQSVARMKIAIARRKALLAERKRLAAAAATGRAAVRHGVHAISGIGTMGSMVAETKAREAAAITIEAIVRMFLAVRERAALLAERKQRAAEAGRAAMHKSVGALGALGYVGELAAATEAARQELAATVVRSACEAAIAMEEERRRLAAAAAAGRAALKAGVGAMGAVSSLADFAAETSRERQALAEQTVRAALDAAIAIEEARRAAASVTIQAIARMHMAICRREALLVERKRRAAEVGRASVHKAASAISGLGVMGEMAAATQAARLELASSTMRAVCEAAGRIVVEERERKAAAAASGRRAVRRATHLLIAIHEMSKLAEATRRLKSAIRIQSVARMQIAIARRKALLAERKRLAAQRGRAAVHKMSHGLGAIGELGNLAEQRKAREATGATLIQAHSRRFLQVRRYRKALEEQRRRRAATCIQSIARMQMAVRRYREMLAERRRQQVKAAVKTGVRSVISINNMEAMVEERRRAIAAANIQAVQRTQKVLKMRRKQQAAARRVQARYKTNMNMARLKKAREGALMLQRDWRGVLGKRIGNNKRMQQLVAIKMQAAFRGWRARVVGSVLNSIIFQMEIAYEICGDGAVRMEQVYAARKMQRAFHSMRMKRLYREKVAKKEAATYARSVLLVQRFARRHDQLVIQNVVEGMVGKLISERLKQVGRQVAARKLQLLYRQYKERKAEERAARIALRTKQQVQMTMRAVLGKADSRSLPWSSYARSLRTHSHAHSGMYSVSEDEAAPSAFWPYGVTSHGAPPRRMSTPHGPVPPSPAIEPEGRRTFHRRRARLREQQATGDRLVDERPPPRESAATEAHEERPPPREAGGGVYVISVVGETDTRRGALELRRDAVARHDEGIMQKHDASAFAASGLRLPDIPSRTTPSFDVEGGSAGWAPPSSSQTFPRRDSTDNSRLASAQKAVSFADAPIVAVLDAGVGGGPAGSFPVLRHRMSSPEGEDDEAAAIWAELAALKRHADAGEPRARVDGRQLSNGHRGAAATKGGRRKPAPHWSKQATAIYGGEEAAARAAALSGSFAKDEQVLARDVYLDNPYLSDDLRAAAELADLVSRQGLSPRHKGMQQHALQQPLVPQRKLQRVGMVAPARTAWTRSDVADLSEPSRANGGGGATLMIDAETGAIMREGTPLQLPKVADAVRASLGANGALTDEGTLWEPPPDHPLYPRYRRLQKAARERATVESTTLPAI